jgi:unsaturated rhamnogalacturonyl hydrolase
MHIQTHFKVNVFRTLITAFIFLTGMALHAQGGTPKPGLKWSECMAVSVMKHYPKAWQLDDADKPKWDYKPSVVLSAFEVLYTQTENSTYRSYIKEYADTFIDSTGSNHYYHIEDYNIDYVEPGKLLFDLYADTKDSRYLSALQLFRKQLEEQPRTPSGGFWHKKIYPDQMWMDGLYMSAPFYTRYTVTFENGKQLDDIAKQFELIHDHAMDKKIGLPYHAWDESKQIGWADKQTGTSPTIWARGAGWYAMALVDALDYFPKTHPKYKLLVQYLNEAATALEKQQATSGLWYQVIDKPVLAGNYLEASGSAMFAYTFAKGANKGYLPKRFIKKANKAFDAIVKNFVTTDADGAVHISGISQSFGLGGKPFRDGSNAFYLNVKPGTDDSIGIGAFMLAALELGR